MKVIEEHITIKKERYQATDGEIFEDLASCLTHETMIEFNEFKQSDEKIFLNAENTRYFLFCYLKNFYSKPAAYVDFYSGRAHNVLEFKRFVLFQAVGEIIGLGANNQGLYRKDIDMEVLYTFLFKYCGITIDDIPTESKNKNPQNSKECHDDFVWILFNAAYRQNSTNCFDILIKFAKFDLHVFLSYDLINGTRITKDVISHILFNESKKDVWIPYLLGLNPKHHFAIKAYNKTTLTSNLGPYSIVTNEQTNTMPVSYQLLTKFEKLKYGSELVENNISSILRLYNATIGISAGGSWASSFDLLQHCLLNAELYNKSSDGVSFDFNTFTFVREHYKGYTNCAYFCTKETQSYYDGKTDLCVIYSQYPSSRFPYSNGKRSCLIKVIDLTQYLDKPEELLAIIMKLLNTEMPQVVELNERIAALQEELNDLTRQRNQLL